MNILYDFSFLLPDKEVSEQEEGNLEIDQEPSCSTSGNFRILSLREFLKIRDFHYQKIEFKQ